MDNKLLFIGICLLLLATTGHASRNDGGDDYNNYPSDLRRSDWNLSCFTKEKDAYVTASAALTTDAANLALAKAEAFHHLALMGQTC